MLATVFTIYEGLKVYVVDESNLDCEGLLFGEVAQVVSDGPEGTLVALEDGRRGFVVGVDYAAL